MNTESANKFIAALVKSLQTLCHGYVDFDDGIEIIGHLYLNIDSGSTFDYVVKEKVCKNTENATVFVSKSFHAEGKPENTLIKDPEDKLAANLGDHAMSPSGTTRLQSAITNISNVLSGTPSHHSSHSSSPHQNPGKRKREHNGNYSQHPYKYTTLQSSSSSAMPYFSNNPAKHPSSNRDNSKHYNNPQSEFFGGDSNQSSGMGPEDEEDLDLDVTFVKEEYAERNAAHRSAAAAAARAHQDPSTNQGNMLPENNGGESGGNYPMAYHQNPNAPNQSFGGDMTGMSQSFQDPSQVDVGQHHIPPPPNPRTTLTSAEGSNTLLPSAGPYNLASGGFASSASFTESGKLKVESVIHTIRQNKWAVARAREFLNSQGMSTDFEQFSDTQLNEILLSFYTSAQKKDGAPFSGTALLAFRTAINRHLNQCGRQISLATSQTFKPSNAVLSRIISCTVKVNRAISVQDIVLLYTSDILSISNPLSLLHKVWFELQIHFRSKVIWDKVRVDQFMFSRNLSSKLCVTWNTSDFGNNGEVSIQGTGGRFCPVESLRLYLHRRHKSCSAFLQVPASTEMVKKGIWYAPEEFKESREKGLMKKLSVLGKLSKSYTNSCVVNSFEDYFQAMLNLRAENDS